MRDYLRTVSLCFEFGKTTELQSRSRESGFKPPMSDAHLTIYRAVKLNSVIQYGRIIRQNGPKRKYPSSAGLRGSYVDLRSALQEQSAEHTFAKNAIHFPKCEKRH